MHELSLAEGILGIVERAARQQGFSRVKEIRLAIGALAGVEVEALEFSLAVVLRGSLAENAAVVLDTLPGTGWCMTCGQTVPIAARYDACPQCGGYQVEATGGTEMRVKDLLVE